MDELATEYQDGATLRELATKHGCSPEKIRYQLIKAGVTMRSSHRMLNASYRRISRGSAMDQLTEQVNIALDRVRAEHGLNNETQLADHFGIKRITLYRWRNGKFSVDFRNIIPRTVLVNVPIPAYLRDQSADIRILAPLLMQPQIDT